MTDPEPEKANSSPTDFHAIINVNHQQARETKNGLGTAANFLNSFSDLLKVVLWPALVFYIFLIFESPLKTIIGQLPRTLSDAQRVSIGSLSIEIQAQAEKVNRTLSKSLRYLSPEAVIEIIKIGERSLPLIVLNDKFYYLPSQDEQNELAELEFRHLLRCSINQYALNETLQRLPLTIVPGFENVAMVYQADTPLSVTQNAEIQNFLGRGCSLTPLGEAALGSIEKAVVIQLDTGMTAQ